jgi:hypothetical protein
MGGQLKVNAILPFCPPYYPKEEIALASSIVHHYSTIMQHGTLAKSAVGIHRESRYLTKVQQTGKQASLFYSIFASLSENHRHIIRTSIYRRCLQAHNYDNRTTTVAPLVYWEILVKIIGLVITSTSKHAVTKRAKHAKQAMA